MDTNGLGPPSAILSAHQNPHSTPTKPLLNGKRTASSSSSLNSSNHLPPDSPSHHSIVRFDEDQSHQIPSKLSPRNANQNGVLPYQPTHPSILHNSSIPPGPKTAPLLSSQSRSNSGLRPFPSTPPALKDSDGSSRPNLPRNQSSQDRRVWSETLPPGRAHRSGSLLAQGKRASRVTGGYESSSDEEGTSEESTKEKDEEETPVTDTYSFSGNGKSSPRPTAIAGPSRPRAKSLMLPLGGQGSDRSSGSLQTRRRRGESQTLQIRTSRDFLRQPPSRIASQRSTRQPLSAAMPTSRSENLFPSTHGSAAPSRVASTRSHVMETGVSGPSRSASARVKNMDRANGRNERPSSPEGSKKGKAKEKEMSKRPDNLAASLGLGIGGIKEMALSADQIHDLLKDSDLASALRIMNTNHLTTPRPPLLPDPGSSNFFSPPNTRPTTPSPDATPHISPYLVSAPPALTGEPHGRERTASIASSIGPPMRTTWGSSPRHRASFDSPGESFAQGRARAASRASMSPDDIGGHIPFTHHIPIAQVDEERETDEESHSVEVQDDVPTAMPSETEPATAKPIGSKTARTGSKEKKGRLSQLFHLGKRKGSDIIVPELQPRDRPKEQRLEKHRSEEHAKEKAKLDKEAEMRRLEQERRADELAQERRYKALTQVAAHPTAERIAYRAGSHLRAYYQHVYDGVDHPPRLNPLAVLRWRTKTDEQNETRSKWEAQQDHGDVTSTRSDKSGAHHASPRAGGPHWGDMLHASPMSVDSPRFKGSRKSLESNHSVSRGSTHRSHDMSPRKKKAGYDGYRSSRGWEYSVEDIASYKACNGVVNYFIPPRRKPIDIDVMTEDEREFGRFPASNNDRRDDESSMAGSRSSKKNENLSRHKVQTASNVSLVDGEGLTNGEGSVAPLSRTTSAETGGKSITGVLDQRFTHRSHQSLSGLGQSSLTHALKQPFEKLSSTTKRQRTMPPIGRSDRDGESVLDESFSRNDAVSTPVHQIKGSHPMVSKASRTTMLSNHSRQQFFRRHGGHESITDDEGGREFHLRKLFMKGQKVFALDDGRSVKRSETDLARDRRDEREAELYALESALAREAAFRQTQAEATRKTQLEVEARERIKNLETEIYLERVERLDNARQKLDSVNANIEVVDESIRQYVAQIDFLQEEAKIGAEVEVEFPHMAVLRTRYTGRRRSYDDEAVEAIDEHRDKLPPLRHFSAHESGSDWAPPPRRSTSLLTPVSGPRPRARTQSQSRSPASATRRRMSTSNAKSPFEPQFTLHMRHRPRRTYLDPSGTSRVNPLRQAELVIAYGRDRQRDLVADRESTKHELERMIVKIENLIKAKENVRHWARDKLQKTTSLREQLDQLVRQEHSGADINFAEWRDSALNSTIRGILTFFKFFFWLYYQAKAEIDLYLTPFKPSTYCRRQRRVKSPNPADGSAANGGATGDNADDDGEEYVDDDSSEEFDVDGDVGDALPSIENGTPIGAVKAKTKARKTKPKKVVAPTWGERKRKIPVLGMVSLGVCAFAIFWVYTGGLKGGRSGLAA
ncbi:hypothetical protein CI109_104742 [Kwoniella shandongensis]|uniref:Uncharacterized protein n=1 Tax=Kwoniella shandongensis TaxID=1734106 RepID=A0A5M6BP40_9TREE|nr:uncharacterized protein CI109_006981 [Kwoniella shandongensis]KAA5524658.1 hypothetical protein CI109_006981 [Kwoniella shandongensis]